MLVKAYPCAPRHHTFPILGVPNLCHDQTNGLDTRVVRHLNMPKQRLTQVELELVLGFTDEGQQRDRNSIQTDGNGLGGNMVQMYDAERINLKNQHVVCNYWRSADFCKLLSRSRSAACGCNPSTGKEICQRTARLVVMHFCSS